MRMMTMSRLVVLSFLGGFAMLLILGALLFGCAGRWDLPMFWAYLGIWAAGLLVGMFVVDPGMVRERIRPGPGGRDYVTVYVFLPVLLGQLVVAALDVGRFHWSDRVPPIVQIAA